jgi:Ca2+-binding EF-hand superfamily protein
MLVARVFVLAVVAMLAAPAFNARHALSSSSQKPAPFQAARAADAVATFLKLFDALDADRNGIVPLPEVFDALSLEHAEARQVKRVRALDGNGDGKVTRAEAIAGIHAEIVYQTNRGMNTDADGDDILTPTEYALSFADPNGKADASGLTPAQQKAFKEDDLNGDGKITRDEIETRVVRAYGGIYWSQWMAVRARRADFNHDGAIDEREFASLEGVSPSQPLPATTRQRFLSAGAKDGKLSAQSLYLFFIRLNDEQRAGAEKRMDAFEERLKTTDPQNSPRE